MRRVSVLLLLFSPGYKKWKSRSAHDLSWGLLILLFTGVFFWMIYGIINTDTPITLANMITGCFILSLVGMKWWFDHMKR